MTTFIVTMLFGWLLSAFGWMALAAAAATLLAYVFVGKKAAAVAGVLAVAGLIGWQSFGRNLWASYGRPGDQLAAKEQGVARNALASSGRADRQLMPKAQSAAKTVTQRTKWQNWNKGADEEVNSALARLAMQSGAMGGVGGGMGMPNVQVPKIRPPTGAPAHSGPLFGGTPGQVTVTASRSAPVAAAAPTAAHLATMSAPMPAVSTEGEAEGGMGGATLPAATAGATVNAKATSPASSNATAAANQTNASLKSTAAGSKQSATSGPAGSVPADGKPKPTSVAGAGSTNRSGTDKAASGKASRATQDAHPSITQPATGGLNKQQTTKETRPGAPGKASNGGPGQQARTLPKRYRPHYQPTAEDSLQLNNAGNRAAAGGRNSVGGLAHANGNQPHSTSHTPRYQNTEQFVGPYLPGANGNHPMSGMGQGLMGGRPMGGVIGPMHGGAMPSHGGGYR